jgi:type IV pilus assembly protein PilO
MTARPTSPWRERLANPLTWYYAGFALLLALVIALAVRFGLDWVATNGSSTNALAGKQIELKAIDLQTAPLRGLDKRVEISRAAIKTFYAKRIPASYSSFATRIGELEVESGVRLSRLQYTQGPPGSDLTEISLDAGITGTYPQIMRFINHVERDQNFFVIRNMAFTGQQGGVVSLRLKLSTWLRPADAEAAHLPPTPGPDEKTDEPAQPSLSHQAKEGE